MTVILSCIMCQVSTLLCFQDGYHGHQSSISKEDIEHLLSLKTTLTEVASILQTNPVQTHEGAQHLKNKVCTI